MSLLKQKINPFANLCYDIVNHICGYINHKDRMIFNTLNKKNYIEYRFKSTTNIISSFRNYKLNISKLLQSTLIKNLNNTSCYGNYFKSRKYPLMIYIIFINNLIIDDSENFRLHTYSMFSKSYYISELFPIIKYIITSGWFKFEKDYSTLNNTTPLYLLVDTYLKFNSMQKKAYHELIENQNHVDKINNILYSIIKLVLNYGNDDIFKKVKKETIFSRAVYIGTNESKIKLAKLFLKKNIDINETDGYNKTALQWCCRKSDNLPIIQYLLDNGADINKMENGASCLYSSLYHHDNYVDNVYRNNIKLFEYLIKNGANMYKFIDLKRSGKINGHRNLIEYILLFRSFSREDKKKLIEILAENNYNFNKLLPFTKELILMLNINDTMRKWLLKNCNIDVNKEIKKGLYDNYLDYAIQNQRIGFTRMLIKEGISNAIVTKELEKYPENPNNKYKTYIIINKKEKLHKKHKKIIEVLLSYKNKCA